jgi:hypothetical protein
MGDMADYLLDQITMYDEDFLDEGPSSFTCKYCKSSPFWWQEDDAGKWRLVTLTGRTHRCKQYETL